MNKYTAFFSSLAAATTFSCPAIAETINSADDINSVQKHCMLVGMSEILPSSNPEFSHADAFNGSHFRAIADNVTMKDDQGNDESVRVNSFFWFSASGEPHNDVSVVGERGHASSGLIGEPVLGQRTSLRGGRSQVSQHMMDEVRRVHTAMKSLSQKCLGLD